MEYILISCAETDFICTPRMIAFADATTRLTTAIIPLEDLGTFTHNYKRATPMFQGAARRKV